MNICILGCGAYAIALATSISRNNHNITMWTKFIEEKNSLEKNRENKSKLPGVKLDNKIKFTTDLNEAIKDKELIVIALPASAVGSTSKELKEFIKENQHICLASKGIEQGSCLFVEEILKKYINSNNIAVISGPSFASDMVTTNPIGLSLATKNKKTLEVVKNALENKYLKLRETDDIIGIEICGSIKNVIAIASGILDGMHATNSTKAMFITESLHDIKELIDSLGGDKLTILSFAGFGDLLLTCTSEQSRNFKFGKLIGSKASKEEIDNYINNTTIEGLYTLKSIHKLLKNKKVNIPIIDLIYNIIFKSEQPEKLFEFLITK